MTPRLQIALDQSDLVVALTALQKAGPYVDIIECGTVLLLHEGLRAVREIRAFFPQKPILADVRIAEAGAILSQACFKAGASWVSCVAGASLTTVEQVVRVARDYGGAVQVELAEEHYSLGRATAWAELGVEHVIVKRSRDSESAGVLTWSPQDFQRIAELKELGFTVTITGGIKPEELDTFAGVPIDIVIAGRSIVETADPGKAARQIQESLGQVWP